LKGINFIAAHQIEIKDDLPKPTIKPDEVLIKVRYVGICGTDIEFYGTRGPVFPNTITGHEFSGEIVEIGENVRKLKNGMRVTVNPQIVCNDCYWCKHNQENMCAWQNYALGTTEDGAMREYINVKAERVHILPDNVSYEMGATVEPLAVVLYAVKESEFKIGEKVAVYGGGTIGLLAIQVLKTAGASKIFVVEPVESKQQKTLELGADKVFKPQGWNRITRFTDKIGPGYIFDCVGLPSTIMTSLQLIRKGGHIIMIGIHTEPFEMKGFMNLPVNNISIRGTFGYTQETYKNAINLFEQNKVNVDPIITNKIKIEQVPEMFEILANPPHEEIKVLVEFD